MVLCREVIHPGRQARRSMARLQRPAELLQLSLSARRVRHRAPWLASLHRTVDAILLGSGLCGLVLGAMVLQGQRHWTGTYRRLQASRALEQRLVEATNLLESHLRDTSAGERGMVSASSSDLVFLTAPPPPRPPRFEHHQHHRPLDLGLPRQGY